MKKKNARQTILKKVERTRAFVKDKHDEARGQLKTLIGLSGCDQSTGNTTAKSLPSAECAGQLRGTLEFLTDKEREIDSMKAALRAIRQLPAGSADDKAKKDASGDVKGDVMRTARQTAEAMKKLSTQLAEVSSQVTRCVAKDRKKLKLVKLACGVQDAQGAASVQDSETQSQSQDWPLVTTAHSSESSPATPASSENFSCGASTMEMATEPDSTDSEDFSLKNASEHIPLATVMTASGAQEQDAVRSGSPSKTPGYTLRGNSTSLEATDENSLAVNDSPPPVSPMSLEESLQTTVVTPQSSGVAYLSRDTFPKLSSLIDFGQPRNDPELTQLTPPGEMEAASGIALLGAPTGIQPTTTTPPLQTSASEPLSPPPSPQDITPPWKVKAFLDQTPNKCAEGTAKDAGRTDVLMSPNQTMRVVLVKSSDIVGYGGPGIFDQTHSWTSIQLDRDMIMDRVSEYIRTYLGLVNRGLMRLWVFERSSEGHFLPRSILKGKTMRSRLSTFGRNMVVLFVQFAEDSRRLYTFNHQHERLVFIKSRDINSGQAVVYGHHVVNTSMCTRRVVEILQEKFLGSASTRVQCYVESSPGQTESVRTGSTSTFKADLGRFCQHGVILWLGEDGSDAKRTSPLTADDVECYKALKVNISTVPKEIGAYNNAIISDGCHKQVNAYKNFVNANDDCSRQLAACSSSICRDARHEHLNASNSSINSDDIHHHVAAYDRFVNASDTAVWRGTAVEAVTWSPGPASAPFSHLDLTHLYFQRASLSDSSNAVVVHSALRQPQFIVPLNPSVTLTAMPVAGFQQGHVTQFGHVNNPDSPALVEDLVYETVGSVQHVSNGRISRQVCDSNSKTTPSCCEAVPKSSGCDDRKVKEKSCQAEKVISDAVTHKKPGDMEDRGTLSDISGSKILLETPSGRHSESSVKTMPEDVGKPANQTPDPAATSPFSSRNSTPATASCAPLNVNALEFIPGSKLEARDNTLLGSPPSEINASSSFSAATSTNVQKPSRDFDSLTSEEHLPKLDSTMKPTQGLATPMLDSAENESEYAKDTRHEQWTASLNAEAMKASDAEKVRSNTNPPEASSNCHRHSNIFGKGTAFKDKIKAQHATDEIRSEFKHRSSCRVSQGREFSLPPRYRGPDNQQQTARQNVFRPQQNRYSSWTESCSQTADRFRPFPQHASRCFTPGALAQNLNFSLPRGGCLPQGRQGCSDSNQACGQKWSRSRQSWNGDMFFQRKSTFHQPSFHNARPSLEPVCTRKFADAKRETAREASNVRCSRSSAEDCCQITQSNTDKVVVSDGNRPETDLYVGDRSGKAALSEHVTPNTVIPATHATKKPAFIARPVAMQPCRAFCRYDRIFQLPRFASSVELHAYNVAPSRRFIQLGCSRNDVRQSGLGRAVARDYSQERLCLGQRPSHVFPNEGPSRNSFASSPAGGSAVLSPRLSAAEASENSPPREASAPAAQADLPRVRKGFIRYVSPSVKNVPQSPTL